MLPEDMSVKESHDIALMLQHKVLIMSSSQQPDHIPTACLHLAVKAAMLYKLFPQSPNPLCSNFGRSCNDVVIVAYKE